MNYIKKGHLGYTFNQDYKQIFKNRWNSNVAAQVIVSMRSNGSITDNDMKMLKFLFQTNFATAEMLYRLTGANCKFEVFEGILERHVKNRVMNKFALSQFEGGTIPEDALCVYCLDVGGKILLSHFSNYDTTNWYTIVNMKCPELVTRDLVAGNFLIKLYETCPNKVRYFKTEPVYRIGRTTVTLSFELGLMCDNQLVYFVGEVVRDYDYPIGIKNKMINFESVLTTKAIKKYFAGSSDQPIFIAICENDQNAKDSFNVFNEVDVQKLFVTTDERMKEDLFKNGTFLMSNEEGAIGQVALDIFKP